MDMPWTLDEATSSNDILVMERASPLADRISTPPASIGMSAATSVSWSHGRRARRARSTPARSSTRSASALRWRSEARLRPWHDKPRRQKAQHKPGLCVYEWRAAAIVAARTSAGCSERSPRRTTSGRERNGHHESQPIRTRFVPAAFRTLTSQSAALHDGTSSHERCGRPS